MMKTSDYVDPNITKTIIHVSLNIVKRVIAYNAVIRFLVRQTQAIPFYFKKIMKATKYWFLVVDCSPVPKSKRNNTMKIFSKIFCATSEKKTCAFNLMFYILLNTLFSVIPIRLIAVLVKSRRKNWMDL